MRDKGKLISWHEHKAFGFIAPCAGGAELFVHKTAFVNRARTPQLTDVITYTRSKDPQGRPCAVDASFSGEKLRPKQPKKVAKFSIYLATVFLAAITIAWLLDTLPRQLVLIYWVLSVMTFLAYALDKAKARRGAWRTKESTLHLFALLGGWPGAAIAQQLLRHKSHKRAFRLGFWLTVIVNGGAFSWLISPAGHTFLRATLT